MVSSRPTSTSGLVMYVSARLHCPGRVLTYDGQFIFNKNGRNITVFCRLDRGLTLVDHHCFFFFEGLKAHVHHASFETHDFDIQKIGHDWLREKGYINCWGVGRHVLGSQIFDY
jgi:hypothetical protein